MFRIYSVDVIPQEDDGPDTIYTIKPWPGTRIAAWRIRRFLRKQGYEVSSFRMNPYAADSIGIRSNYSTFLQPRGVKTRQELVDVLGKMGVRVDSIRDLF